MPRDSENQQSTQHGTGTAGGSHDIDFDAEHSPAISRRASNAVLRHKAAQVRTADASSVTNAPQAERNKQHDKADLAELHGLQSAIMLAAKHLIEDVVFIRATVQKAYGTDAGVSPALQLVDGRINRATSEMDQLSRRIGRINEKEETGMTSSARQLVHEFGALNHGVMLFEQALIEAKNLAHEHRPEKLNANTTWLHNCFDLIRNALELNAAGAVIPDTKVDARPESELFAETLGFNLSAAYEAARSVRMGLGANTELHVATDLEKVIRHVGLLAYLVRHRTDPKALGAHKKRIREVLTEIHSLEKQIQDVPKHADTLHARAADDIRTLQSAVDH
jgi:hypothetical protein